LANAPQTTQEVFGRRHLITPLVLKTNQVAQRMIPKDNA